MATICTWRRPNCIFWQASRSIACETARRWCSDRNTFVLRGGSRAPERRLGWRRSARGGAPTAFSGRQAARSPARRRGGGVPDAVDPDHRQLHDQPAEDARAFRIQLRPVGREVLSDEAGREPTDGLALVGDGGGGLVPGQRGHQRHGLAAGPSLLAALRTAHGRTEGRSRGDRRERPEPDAADRDLQPPPARPAAAVERGRRTAAPGRSQETGGPRRANAVNRLRNRLIGIFLAATLVPLAATLWITTSLLDRSLSYASTGELDRLSRSLQKTGKELYQRACDALKNDALGGRLEPLRYAAAQPNQWPAPVKSFFDSGDSERFLRSGRDGDHIEYLSRRGDEVWQWSTSLGGVGLDELSREYRNAREIVEKRQSRDLLRGFTYTYVLLAASVWIASLVLLVYLAHRISGPIQQLTAGLSQLAAGDLAIRVEARRDDEIGRAMCAFNDMAERLQHST